MRRNLVFVLFFVMSNIVLFQDASGQFVQPNSFELRTNDIEITYSTTSLDGRPQLTYKDQNLTRAFAGEAIRSLETEIGRIVTVTIEVVYDFKTVTLSLLLPDINLPKGAKSILFKTQVIFTTRRTSIDGPRLVRGQLQTYRTITFEGQARLRFH